MADIRECMSAGTTTPTPVITTAETIAITAPLVDVPFNTMNALVLGYAQLTTGTNTTTITPRIRRGAAITSPLVGAANAENIKAAAGGTEEFFLMVSESLSNLAEVQYSLSLQAAGASANGSILQASILVLLL